MKNIALIENNKVKNLCVVVDEYSPQFPWVETQNQNIAIGFDYIDGVFSTPVLENTPTTPSNITLEQIEERQAEITALQTSLAADIALLKN